ncbi:MAG: class I SAM-dependent methyltransferase [Gemmataceae bacterium]|nr:class I SAM-dependent methyltransferase [Gemmataceae bacterium]MDW8264352.1 methyltransferase [Gemmataceae bacterium]
MHRWLRIPTSLAGRLSPPVVVVLGSPLEAAGVVSQLGGADVSCYQMDVYQAARLEAELRGAAKVCAAPDLWDLPPIFGTAIYPAPEGGERALKLDMVEQAYHVLRPQGLFLVLSPYEADSLFPSALKKVFGRVHVPTAAAGSAFWCRRGEDRPRRRHEVVFHARLGDGPALRFVSRPGTFSYGRFDDGARALAETMEVRPGDRVLDLGCGCGTIGTFAGKVAGSEGHVVFVDSNVRAVALAEYNARTNGLTAVTALAAPAAESVADESMDVVVTNPPYYAQSSIARLFIRRGQEVLRPSGRFYLVTRQPAEVASDIKERFGSVATVERRGYTVFCARKS